MPVLLRVLATFLLAALLAVLIIILIPNRGGLSGSNETNQDSAAIMRVVRVHFSGTSIQTEDLGLVPGNPPVLNKRSVPGMLYYQARDPDGQIIAQAPFPDPRVVFYDAPVDETGRLEGGTITQENAVFDIRLPANEAPLTLSIIDHTESPAGELLHTTQLPPASR